MQRCIIIIYRILLVNDDKKACRFLSFILSVLLRKNIKKAGGNVRICLCLGFNLKCVNGLFEDLRK